MSTGNELALKSQGAEEWLDVHFFRPLGIRVARSLLNTPVSANQVTFLSLVVGLLGAHLFLYELPWVNALGFVLIVIADVFDSADGQLARLRGTASLSGRMMDGYVDNLRWFAVYLHVALRVMGGHFSWPIFALGWIVGYTHSLQSSVQDFVLCAHAEVVFGSSHVDLPEDLAPPPSKTLLWRIGTSLYAGYTRRQAVLFSRTAAVVRQFRSNPRDVARRQRYAERVRPAVVACTLIGQNAHIVLLGAAGISGHPAAFFWGVGTAMTLAAGLVVVLHERAAPGI